jgi:hypothetical protein
LLTNWRYAGFFLYPGPGNVRCFQPSRSLRPRNKSRSLTLIPALRVKSGTGKQTTAPSKSFIASSDLPLDVAVQGPLDADPSEHRRAAVAFGDQDQDFNGCLPFLDLLFGLRQLLDISGGILEGDELAAGGQRDRIVEFTLPAVNMYHLAGLSILVVSARSLAAITVRAPQPRPTTNAINDAPKNMSPATRYMSERPNLLLASACRSSAALRCSVFGGVWCGYPNAATR